jgi:hypothetical protein
MAVARVKWRHVIVLTFRVILAYVLLFVLLPPSSVAAMNVFAPLIGFAI